jgi:hypothetical protein
MYLEETLFFDFIPPTQNPIGFSLISHFRCARMTDTEINGIHGSARNGQNWPEWPELSGILPGTGCCVFLCRFGCRHETFRPFRPVPEWN